MTLYFYNNYTIYFSTVDPPYFIVQNIKDLSQIDGHMPLKTVIKVSRTLKKRSAENNSLQQVVNIQMNMKNKYFTFLFF